MENPIVEYHSIRQWLDNFANRSITPENFIRRLSKYLNKTHSLKMQLVFNNDILSSDDFTIGGLYEPSYDEEHRKPLVLIFYVNHASNTLWKITELMIESMSLELTETLVHEYRHLHQYRSRGYMVDKAYRSRVEDVKLREEQEYLGSTDEIDAYAMNIAVRKYLGYSDGYDLLRYKHVFGDHLVTRRLHKKIAKNIQLLRFLNT